MINTFFLQLASLFITASFSIASPMDVVRDSNKRVQNVFRDKEQAAAERDRQINEIIDSVTSFEKISRSTIGRFCRKLSESECDKFDSVFQKLLRLSSVSKLGRYRADRFDYIEEKVDGNKAVVKTVAYFSSDRVDLDYYLENINGRWMIVNYVADDIDTVRNYRRQFARILKKEAFTGLLKRLERKVATYEKTQ